MSTGQLTDSEMVLVGTLDVAALVIALVAGTCAPLAVSLTGIDTTGIAVAAAAVLVFNQNLRRVAVLRRRTRRRSQGEE